MEIGNYSIHFDRLASTNDLALKLLRFHTPPDGLEISTNFQFKGRGQHDSIWLSEKGKNITLSIITYPSYLNTSAIYILNKAVCLGVAKCVEHLTTPQQVQIKWPNDVYVNEQKISGVLIQNTVMGRSIQNSIIGIGLNVNQLGFPAGIKATSLRLIKDRVYDTNDVRKTLFKFLQDELITAKSGAFDLIDSEYQARLLGLNQERTFLISKTGKTFAGKVRGVDQLGKLHIDRGNVISYYQVKEIEFLI